MLTFAVLDPAIVSASHEQFRGLGNTYVKDFLVISRTWKCLKIPFYRALQTQAAPHKHEEVEQLVNNPLSILKIITH